MRTPNSKCVICGKLLYRRPYELKKIRYVSCIEHREEAKRMYPITEAQKNALELGRKKGKIRPIGIPQTEETKRKRSITAKHTYEIHPEIAIERGKRSRAENHYRWNGGSSKLNTSIRTMTENRKWMDSVKARDKVCARCGSSVNLESHHIKPVAEILEKNKIANRTDARNCDELWDLCNGITLCRKCHYDDHGRKYNED